MMDDRFDELYEIMIEAFPAFELRSERGQRALLGHPSYRLLTEERGGRIVGFLAYWELTRCRFAEHVATRPEARGGGLGAGLMNRVTADSPLPVILEIEPPVDELSRRRAGFYRRLGFALNDFYYEQLPLKAGDAPVELRIMSHPAPLTPEEFAPLKAEIQRVVYGAGRE